MSALEVDVADVPVLVCTAGSIQGRKIPVPDGGLKIGRAPENDLILEGDGVSRFHARLLLDEGSLWLQDAGSRNGVFVNGVRVTGHQALRVEDAITVGSHEFTVRWAVGDDESGVYPMPKIDEKTAWWWPFGRRNE